MGDTPDAAQKVTASTQATATKRRFVAAFNPLAKRFHRKTWTARQF